MSVSGRQFSALFASFASVSAREDSVIHSKTADLVTIPELPQKFAFSNGLYVPLCA